MQKEKVRQCRKLRNRAGREETERWWVGEKVKENVARNGVSMNYRVFFVVKEGKKKREKNGMSILFSFSFLSVQVSLSC